MLLMVAYERMMTLRNILFLSITSKLTVRVYRLREVEPFTYRACIVLYVGFQMDKIAPFCTQLAKPEKSLIYQKKN